MTFFFQGAGRKILSLKCMTYCHVYDMFSRCFILIYYAVIKDRYNMFISQCSCSFKCILMICSHIMI